VAFLLAILALTTLYGFSPKIRPIDEPYFTIHAGEKTYVVSDETLRGGWWNDAAQKKLRAKHDLKFDDPDLQFLIKKIIRENEIKPENGTIVFRPHSEQKFTVAGQKMGRKIDEKSLIKNIKSTRNWYKNTHIYAIFTPVLPPFEYQIVGKIALRGGYTTYFESNPPRENNINLALSKFNGLVIERGQTVSFNSVVGKRTTERGFEEAKIIQGGEFVPGVGGGVCQASTTLFNALLTAGVKIDKSHNHSLLVSYVPIGRDAMVSSGADLKFTNNTGGTIYIETGTTDATETEQGCAWVKIYGNATHIKYKPRVTVTEMELNDGEIDPARKSVTYLDEYNGENLVYSKKIRKSGYSAVKEKPEPKPAPAA
jgi:vancomycin resistance protein YoaR